MTNPLATYITESKECPNRPKCTQAAPELLRKLPGAHEFAVAAGGGAELHLGVKAQLTRPGHQPEQLTADVLARLIRSGSGRAAITVQPGQFAGHPGPGRPALQLRGQRQRGLPERHAVQRGRSGLHRRRGTLAVRPGLVSLRA